MALNLRKIGLWTVAAVAVIVGLAWATVEVRSKRTFDAPYPTLVASDPATAVERGRYLVHGPAACAYCHVPRERWKELDAGAELPLSGNHLFRLPFGELFSANITPDDETGIGRRTDPDIARVLRHGVRADGRAAFPLMSFQGMSDQDLAAVIAYLRSRPAVRLAVPGHRLSLLGKALMAFAIEPAGPTTTPRTTSPTGPSVERGDYLANLVSSCAECHTDRNPDDGSFVGPKFGGGQRMDLAADPNKVAVPPNLTPHMASPIGQWTEDAFLVRFRQGEVEAGTPMPWGAYKRMTEDDMRSIYRYLRTLPPYAHMTGAGIQAR